MAFNGSTNFKKNELVDYLESVGAKFGPDLNAYTSFDETVYMLQIRTDDQEQMLKGLLVLEDWAGGVAFDEEEIDKERGVVESEWRTRLSPDQRMQQKYFPVMYKDSRYAERLPIGDPDIINNASYETVKRFYKDWYRPDLMAVVAVGDFDMDQMEAEIKARFSKLSNPDTPRAKDNYTVPPHPETLVSICSDKESPFTRVRVEYKHKSQDVTDISDFRKQMTHNLYNSMLNARLDELAQSPEPPFTFSYSGFGKNVGDISTYTAYAFVPEGGVQKGLNAVLTENERVLQHGFTPTEMARAKLKTIKAVERGVKEMDKTESRRLVQKYIYHFLQNNPIPSPKQQLSLYEEHLPGIQLSEVNDLAKEWIIEENRVVIVTAPEKEGVALPTEQEILGILNTVALQEVDAYVDKVSDEPLLATTLNPVTIEEEKALEEIDATELRLANGVRVVLKSTDFKNDQIIMRSFSPGGTSLYSDVDYPSASNAASIINESGIGNFELTQLQIDQINLDRVMEIYKDRYADASDFTFFFVGNFDLETMKPLLATYLGNLPSTGRKETWKDLDINLVPGAIKKDLTKGAAPKALIDITYHGKYEGEAIEDQMKFYMMIDLLSIKMRESMREDKGGVYGVRVNGNISKYPKENYSINISFNSEPEKAEELIKTAMNDLEEVRKNGASEKDLTKVRETLSQSRTKALKENNWWMSKMVGTYQNERQDFKYYGLAPFQEVINGVNSEDMQSAVQRYFDDKNKIQIVMMPEPAETN